MSRHNCSSHLVPAATIWSLWSRILKCRKNRPVSENCANGMFTMCVPTNITNNKECKLHTICLKSAKILAWHTYLSHTGRLGKEGTKAPVFPSCSPLQARNEKRRHLIFPLAGLVYNDCGNVVYLTSFSFVFVLLDLSSKIYKTSQDKN